MVLSHDRDDSDTIVDTPIFPDLNASSSSRLPTELLGEIFLDSLPTLREIDDGYDREHPSWEESGARYRSAVSSLGRVCKFWRDVSIATPKMWSRIILGSGLQHPHKVKVWLQRSAQSPLTLRSLLTYWDLKHRVPEVLDHAHRWEDVKMDTDYRGWDDLSARIVQFPLLRTLSLQLGRIHDASFQHQEGGWKLHILAPELSSVELKTADSVMWDIRLIDIRLPSSQLTHLRLDAAIEAQEMFELLRASRNLVSLVVCVDYLHGLRSVSPTPTTRLPLLESLDIEGNRDHDEETALLHYLDLPALTKFCCRTSTAHEWPFTPLVALVSRSRCSIQTLIIHLRMDNGMAGVLWNDDFIECLQRIPGLVSLEIVGHGAYQLTTTSLFQRLNGNSSHILRAPCLVPGLKQLNIEINKIQSVEAKTFVDMLQSRSQLASPRTFEPLETVTLTRRRFVQREEVFNLKADGKKIIVTRDEDGREIPLNTLFPGY